ncbi:MAG: flagellar protein FlgN [Acidaminobacteraceae bacterium]
MINLINELVDALDKECDIYSELSEIADNKKQIIIDGKIKELDKITIREQGLAMTLVRLENIREKIVDKIMLELNLTNIETISELISKLDIESKVKLNKSKDKLIGAIKDIKNKNELNGELIKQSLKYIDFNIELLAGLEEDNKYKATGENPEMIQRKSMFDFKV